MKKNETWKFLLYFVIVMVVVISVIISTIFFIGIIDEINTKDFIFICFFGSLYILIEIIKKAVRTNRNEKVKKNDDEDSN